MITIPDLIRMLRNEYGIIDLQTQGLTQADTLLQPKPSGNCMNWVLGHLLESQLTVLKLLGGQSPFLESEVAIYKRESEPILGDEPGVLSLDCLLDYHHKVHALLVERLQQTDESAWAQEVELAGRTYTLGWRIFFLHFHFTYHLGQLELLRQMAGKTEKII